VTFAYKPYATGVPPFSIGLNLLDPDRWIEPDERLAAELAIKERLLRSQRDRVVSIEAETRASQIEIREALTAHLLTAYPNIYQRCTDGTSINIVPAGRCVDLDDDHPLVAAARLVQDDLCIMRRDAGGWRLAAAVLTAPSSWSLAEHFSKPLGEIHAAVPGFTGSMAARVDRIFDHLPADKPVWRSNWSLYDDDTLFHPESKHGVRRWSGSDGCLSEHVYVRVERQTLRRMPLSQDILFTIRVYVDPILALRKHPDGHRLADHLAKQLAALTDAQLRYKNLCDDRDRILELLADIQKIEG
jgi:hypothetical protein